MIIEITIDKKVEYVVDVIAVLSAVETFLKDLDGYVTQYRVSINGDIVEEKKDE